MAKSRDKELIKRYGDLEIRQANRESLIEANRVAIEILLHGTNEDIERFAKEHNKKNEATDENMDFLKAGEEAYEAFLKEYAHRRGMFRYEKDGKVYYGPRGVGEDAEKKAEYSIPLEARLNAEHYSECQRRAGDQDKIMSEAWEHGFEIVYQNTFEYRGVPHTEYIMYCPLYNAAMHLEFDAAEELAVGYHRNKTSIIVPYMQTGHKVPTIVPIEIKAGLRTCLDGIEDFCSLGRIPNTYPKVEGGFPHFTNISEKELIDSGSFTPEERDRIETIIGLGKLVNSDESIRHGFGPENVETGKRVQEARRTMTKTA